MPARWKGTKTEPCEILQIRSRIYRIYTISRIRFLTHRRGCSMPRGVGASKTRILKILKRTSGAKLAKHPLCPYLENPAHILRNLENLGNPA